MNIPENGPSGMDAELRRLYTPVEREAEICTVYGCADAVFGTTVLCDAHKEAGKGLRSKYGITVIDAIRILEEQDNRCALCRHLIILPPCPKDGWTSKAVCDHNHDTGQVRGFVCPECNMQEGMIRKALKHFGDGDMMAGAGRILEYMGLGIWRQESAPDKHTFAEMIIQDGGCYVRGRGLTVDSQNWGRERRAQEFYKALIHALRSGDKDAADGILFKGEYSGLDSRDYKKAVKDAKMQMVFENGFDLDELA